MITKCLTLRILNSGEEFFLTPEFRAPIKIGDIMDLYLETDESGKEIVYAQARITEFPHDGSPLYTAKVI